MSAFCPHCGYNLTPDEPIVAGPWRVAPWSVEVEGRRSRLTPLQCRVLHTVAAAGGRVVSRDTIVVRCCRHEDVAPEIIGVAVSYIRKNLPGIPVQTVPGYGYRWAFGEAA